MKVDREELHRCWGSKDRNGLVKTFLPRIESVVYEAFKERDVDHSKFPERFEECYSAGESELVFAAENAFEKRRVFHSGEHIFNHLNIKVRAAVLDALWSEVSDVKRDTASKRRSRARRDAPNDPKVNFWNGTSEHERHLQISQLAEPGEGNLFNEIPDLHMDDGQNDDESEEPSYESFWREFDNNGLRCTCVSTQSVSALSRDTVVTLFHHLWKLILRNNLWAIVTMYQCDWHGWRAARVFPREGGSFRKQLRMEIATLRMLLPDSLEAFMNAINRRQDKGHPESRGPHTPIASRNVRRAS